jgi:uncharacterized iron-regulated membrane protein
MRPLWPRVNAYLTWFHRWAGVVLSLMFVAWFASGAVLHFVGFPSLPMTEQVAGSETIDLSRLAVAPAKVLAQVADADGLKLISVAGRPVYLASAGGKYISVSGDSGEVLGLISGDTAIAVAGRFGHERVISGSGLIDYDQWVVHQRFDPYRPFYRLRLDDPQRTDLYVSARTGEVVQRTRERERLWNWCGAVLHWIYFTPVRKDWSFWNQLVWWVSLVALLTSIAGTWLGIHRYLKNRATRRSGLSPYRGWMRWHHIIGLFASVVVLSWIFSGWLSMDHGRLFSRGGVGVEQTARIRGISLSSLASITLLQTLQDAGPASVIELNAVARRPFLTLRGGGGAAVARIRWLDTADQSATPLPSSLLLTAVNAVWPTATLETDTSDLDAMYRLAESVPADAPLFGAGPPAETRIYVEPYSGHLLAVMDSSRRAYAWVYYGVHTLNFPGLIAHPATRTGLVMLLLIGGLGFTVTGVVLGIRRLRIQFS